MWHRIDLPYSRKIFSGKLNFYIRPADTLIRLLVHGRFCGSSTAQESSLVIYSQRIYSQRIKVVFSLHTYRIEGNFRGTKISWLSIIESVCGKYFRGCLLMKPHLSRMWAHELIYSCSGIETRKPRNFCPPKITVWHNFSDACSNSRFGRAAREWG